MRELGGLGGSSQTRHGEWMSQRQLAWSAFAAQAQLLGAKARD